MSQVSSRGVPQFDIGDGVIVRLRGSQGVLRGYCYALAAVLLHSARAGRGRGIGRVGVRMRPRQGIWARSPASRLGMGTPHWD